MTWVAPAFADSPENLPANGTTLTETLDKAGAKGLTYLYDFSDDWEHATKARSPKDADPNQTYPHFTDIKNTCPPENIGGPPGFEMFKEALADPEHKDLKDWYRGPFDPTKPDARNLKANVKYSKTAQKALLRNWAVRVRDKARAFAEDPASQVNNVKTLREVEGMPRKSG